MKIHLFDILIDELYQENYKKINLFNFMLFIYLGFIIIYFYVFLDFDKTYIFKI